MLYFAPTFDPSRSVASMLPSTPPINHRSIICAPLCAVPAQADTLPPLSSLAILTLPLRWTVWLLHGILTVFSGWAILIIEATASHVRGEDKEVPVGEPRKHVQGEESEEEPDPISVDGLLRSAYLAVTHFLWDGPKHNPRTVMGKFRPSPASLCACRPQIFCLVMPGH